MPCAPITHRNKSQFRQAAGSRLGSGSVSLSCQIVHGYSVINDPAHGVPGSFLPGCFTYSAEVVLIYAVRNLERQIFVLEMLYVVFFPLWRSTGAVQNVSNLEASPGDGRYTRRGPTLKAARRVKVTSSMALYALAF